MASVSLTIKSRVLTGSTGCTSGLISLCPPQPASTTTVSSLLLMYTKQVLASGPLHSLFPLPEHASSKTSSSHTLSQYQLLGQTSPDRHPATQSKIYLAPFNPFTLLYLSSYHLWLSDIILYMDFPYFFTFVFSVLAHIRHSINIC